MAAVAQATSPNTTQACPRSALERQCTMSTTRPKGEKATNRLFLSGAFFTFSVRFCTYSVWLGGTSPPAAPSTGAAAAAAAAAADEEEEEEDEEEAPSAASIQD